MNYLLPFLSKLVERLRDCETTLFVQLLAEYSFKAVKAASITSIAARGMDSVCVVTQDKLLDRTSITHLFPVTKYLGLLATGMTADARTLVQQARNEAAEFRFNMVMKCPWMCWPNGILLLLHSYDLL
ncbi:proteasome subunit alpha type-6-like isoform X2 [Euphorbia lathyris]|uniref:proteasome subunit alpha type-6-like isoform X2 n=1 Tax=Euphorbia lathyris TaxID=212925 RepID=UPI003313AD28